MAANIDYTVNVSDPVTVNTAGGTPRLVLTIGATTRYAAYNAGASTATALVFRYAVQAGDFDANGIIVTSPVDLNGGTIKDLAGNDLSPLTYTAPVTPNVKVQTYQVVITTDPVTAANQTAFAFQMTKAPIGATFNYAVTSGGGNVTGSGTIATATQNVTGIDVSTLPYGTLTVTLTMTDASGTGAAAADTAPGGVTGALDSLTADGAYSLRRLRSAYTGPLIRVRRSSDNTEQDMNALYGGDLNTAALTTFCGAGSCFVKTWYNQSGTAGRDGTQTTNANQPRIYSGGAVELKNGKATIRHTAGSQNYIRFPSAAFVTSNNFTVSVVEGLDGTANARMLSSYGSNWLLGFWNGNTQSVYFEGTGNYGSGVSPGTNIESYIAIGQTGQQAVLYRNGVDFSVSGAATSQRPGSDLLTSSYTGSSEFSDGHISELVLWNTNIAPATMLTLYNNQKAYFGTP